MSSRYIKSLFLLLVCIYLNQPAIADEYVQQRQEMIEEIQDDVFSTIKYIKKLSFNKDVMKAMESVHRHKFVPEHLVSMAYLNRPLPIGYGQTISQPYVVALMTDLLQPQSGHSVLEIGTGSGYQAAVLSRLVKEVYSIEIIDELSKVTTRRLSKLGYENIHTQIADGYNGWPELAPFDSIIVTAAISHVPPPLIKQLKNGGRMVIPVGTRFQTQYLTLVEKDKSGNVSSRQILPVTFVPFTGEH